MSPRTLTPFLVVIVAACGGDDVNHLADAPLSPDASIDSPMTAVVELDVTTTGAGSGTVTSSPAGIDCGAACTAEFAKGTLVTLTASPGAGSVFAGWSGACSGVLPTCDVTLADATTVGATFDLATYTVTVTRAGAGTGTVTGNGLDCGSTCMVTVEHGTMISLSATPENLSVFAGWGGACTGNGACMVTVTEDTAISANFALDNLTLFVTKGGNGTGTVTSAPAGITCGADCDQTYTANQMVTLTAAPGTGSTFAGWSGGGCTGTSTCTVTMTAATTVTATFTLTTHALTVTRAGNGSGAVTSNPSGIACGSDCTETYDYGQMVTLTAAASAGSSFTGWSGACTGTGPCVVTMTQARAVTATFALDVHALTVTTAGTGMGTVTGTGINCGSDCGESYTFGTMVTLTAAPATGSTFAGWSGACTGTGGCTVTMTQARSVTATFTLDSFALTVTPAGNGIGTVTGTGINCGSDCGESYTFGTMVTLTTAAATGSSFTGWSGACTGTGTCTVTMTQARSVTATFTLQTFTLSVSRPGNGSGTVTGTGIACGADCSEMFAYNTVVTLSATANTGSTFAGWGGACAGTGVCTVTMSQARSVTATFTLDTFVLMVATNGTGAGQVTAPGITCGAGATDCMETINYGTMVTLMPTPSAGSSFGGWAGACTGMGACTVTMTQARSVTATFTINSYTLMVAEAGNGDGTITGTGINCGVDCSESFVYNTMVTLTATPAASSNFTGWSMPCTGTGTCTVTMDQARTMTATFTLKTYTLSVNPDGTGTGTVSGGGINCGSTCSVTVSYGATVTLSAAGSTADSTLSDFAGWSGAGCAGNGGCTISNITANTVVDARFTLRPNIIFVTSGTFNGSLGGLSGADGICKTHAAAKGLSGTYVAYLSGGTIAVPINAPARVGSASGWVRVDGKPVMNAIDEMHRGMMINPPSLTEAGVDVGATQFTTAWTGTSNQGARSVTCNSQDPWVNPTGGEAVVGTATTTTSQAVQNGFGGCANGMHRVYCLGVDRRASVQ